MKSLILILCTSVFSLQAMATDALVRVKKDEYNKIYTVLFAGEEERKVNVQLTDRQGKRLFSENFTGTGFAKRYSLADLPTGHYDFRVSYDGKTSRHHIEIKSLKKLMKESVTLDVESGNLNVEVKEYNTEPLNIKISSKSGEKLEDIHLESSDDYRFKTINLTKYSAGEIEVTVEQNGQNMISKSFDTL